MDKLLAALCLLVVCSLGMASEMKPIPPEDDASGDDEDSYSGSGSGVEMHVNVDGAVIDVYSVSTTLVPNNAQEPIVSEPDSVDEKDVIMQHTTRRTETALPDEDTESIDPAIFVERPAIVPTSSEGTTHRPTTHRTSTAKFTTTKMETDHAVHSGKHHHHHHHHNNHPHHNTTTVSPTLAIDSNADYDYHEGTSASPAHVDESDVLTDHAVHSGKHHHHHHHHHPHHNTTTVSPTLAIDSNADYDYHEGTSASPAHVDESDVLNGDHEEATTSSSGDGESNVQDVHNEVTTLATVEGNIVPHTSYEETTLDSSGAHDVHHKETTADPSDAGEFHVVHGHVEKTTTTPSTVDDSDVHQDHHEHTTAKPAEGADSHVHKGHHEQTSTSSFIVEDSYDEKTEKDHVVESTTPPVDMNKHHHHHHDHPHHHHTSTTPSNTVQTTDSDEQDKVHAVEPRRKIPSHTTSAVPVLDEYDIIPEEGDKLGNSTEEKTSDESESDMSDSKEEDGSGDKSTFNEDIFFETKVENDQTSMNRINQKVVEAENEQRPDASHGIMERTEVLGGIIAGGVAGLIFAVALVGFMLYRMKKKDEGSYSLEEPKQSNGGYQKPREQREFYA